MAILSGNKTFNSYHFKKEEDFERLVGQLAENIFGSSTIYIPKKKWMKGSEIITIPDAYLIDMTEPGSPALYIIENEIVAHDPFKHVGIQLLKFATSFDEAKYDVRKHLMESISEDGIKLAMLERACKQSDFRNIDSYLDAAVYQEFKALVLIDEAREELHNVIQKIRADITVMELKTFVSEDGDFVYQFDTLYDEDDTDEDLRETRTVHEVQDGRIRRRQRRAKCDTIVVPAQEDGFKRVFLGQNQWFAVRIGAAMKERIKYIAAYQVAPISAVTHVAEIDAILPYQNTGKYLIKFKEPAKEITPIKIKNVDKKPQAPVYIKYSDLAKVKSFDELIEY